MSDDLRALAQAVVDAWEMLGVMRTASDFDAIDDYRARYWGSGYRPQSHSHASMSQPATPTASSAATRASAVVTSSQITRPSR